MWTDNAEDRTFVTELSKNIVTEIAPEELPLFDDLIQEYYADSTPPDIAKMDTEEPLSFGLAETLAAVTPAAAAVVSVVLTYTLTEALKTFQAESAEVLKEKIKLFFKKKQPNSIPFTVDQLERARELAIKQAKAFGMRPDEAKRMADALVGSLALSK